MSGVGAVAGTAGVPREHTVDTRLFTVDPRRVTQGASGFRRHRSLNPTTVSLFLPWENHVCRPALHACVFPARERYLGTLSTHLIWSPLTGAQAPLVHPSGYPGTGLGRRRGALTFGAPWKTRSCWA